jgi:hypothetical protein
MTNVAIRWLMIFNYSQYSDYHVAMNICDMYSALVNIVYMM